MSIPLWLQFGVVTSKILPAVFHM